MYLINFIVIINYKISEINYHALVTRNRIEKFVFLFS